MNHTSYQKVLGFYTGRAWTSDTPPHQYGEGNRPMRPAVAPYDKYKTFPKWGSVTRAPSEKLAMKTSWMTYLLSGIVALALSVGWGRAEERILTWDKGGDVVQLRLRMGGESSKAKGVIVLWGQHYTLPEYTNPEVIKEQGAWEQGARELGLGYCLADVVIGSKPTAELLKILSKLCQQGMKGYFPEEARWCLVATSLRALLPVQGLMQFEHKRVAAWWRWRD